MSSPTTVVVVLDGCSPNDRKFMEKAERHLLEWEAVLRENGEDPCNPKHTERVVLDFFLAAKELRGYEDGPEGQVFTFGTAGNYVNSETFCEYIEPFCREMMSESYFLCPVVLFQSNGDIVRAFSLGARSWTEVQTSLQFNTW